MKKEGRPIVFIDESGFPHDTPRTHGYSPKGQACLRFCVNAFPQK
ncbi:hypothetical protein [Symbiopectobacterium sp. RP]